MASRNEAESKRSQARDAERVAVGKELTRRQVVAGSTAAGIAALGLDGQRSVAATPGHIGRSAPAVVRAQETTLSFMGWGQPSEQEVFQSLIDAFQESHPGVSVDYRLVPPADFLQQLTTLAAAGDLPDVFYMASDWFGAWVTRDVLQPLDDLVDPDLLADVWPSALARYRYDGSTIGQGELYALPKDLGPFVHVYNIDLYDQYGVAHPSTDGSWTWDVALEGWQAMTAADELRFGVAGMPLEPFVWSNGADYLNADRTEVTISDPKFIEAFQFVADLACEHHVAPNAGDLASLGAWDMWLQGMVGSFVMGPWDQPTFWDLPFQWDISPYPSSPTTQTPANFVGSMGFGVSAASDHPELAAELAQYFSVNPDGQRMTFELGQAVPNLMSMAREDFLAYERPPASRQVFLDAIETWGRPTLGWYTSHDAWLDSMAQSMDTVWSCENTAEAWAAEAEGPLTEALNEEEQIPAVLPES